MPIYRFKYYKSCRERRQSPRSIPAQLVPAVSLKVLISVIVEPFKEHTLHQSLVPSPATDDAAYVLQSPEEL